MKVQLSKDPLFQIKGSLIKKLKQQQMQRKRQQRQKKKYINSQLQKYQSQKQIVDPLTDQLKQYKQQTSYNKSVQASKASQNLKKYIIQQERNLKCKRQERLDKRQKDQALFNPESSSHIQSQNLRQNSFFGQKSNDSLGSNTHSNRDINMKQSLQKNDQKHTKQIKIPKIQQIFQNQLLQYMLFQNKLLKQRITNVIKSIDDNVLKSSIFSLKENSVKTLNNKTQKHSSKDITHEQKMYRSVNAQNNSHDFTPPSIINLGQLLVKKNQSQFMKQKIYPSTATNQRNHNKLTLKEKSFDQLEIDDDINKRLQMSQKLRKKMYFQKKKILSNIHSVDQHQDGESSGPSKQDLANLSYLLPHVMKHKKKQVLKGVKTYKRKDGDKKYNLTPASYLLFQLHKLSNIKDKKQSELTGLLKNSFQNRQNILNQKSNFYEQQTQLNDLSPSHQFKLRKVMNKKLFHRLQLSKQQINKFINYIYEIKNQYHIILNETILQILKKVREKLLNGKVMKQSDLNQILIGKNQDDLKGYPGEKIISSLAEMMI